MSKAKPTTLQCVVCHRYSAVTVTVDGVEVDVCPDCQKDRFRMPLAIERTRNKRGNQ